MRLAASLVVAGRSRAFSTHDSRRAVQRAIRSYRERMHEYATMRAIDVYYSSVAVASIMAFVDKAARPMIADGGPKSAAHHDALHELPKLTEVIDGHRRIVDHPPVIVHRPEITNPLVTSVLAGYRESLQEDRRVLLDRYEIVDYALKVVGVGSVGLGAFAVLLDGGSDDDPLFLQVKEAQDSVLRAVPRIKRTDHPTGRGSSQASGGSRPRATSSSASPSGSVAGTCTSASSRTRRRVPSSRR